MERFQLEMVKIFIYEIGLEPTLYKIYTQSVLPNSVL